MFFLIKVVDHLLFKIYIHPVGCDTVSKNELYLSFYINDYCEFGIIGMFDES